MKTPVAAMPAARTRAPRPYSELEPGDEILVERRDGRGAVFRMAGARVVRGDASGLDPHAPGRALALATCWPLDGRTRGPLRYVVWAGPTHWPPRSGPRPP